MSGLLKKWIGIEHSEYPLSGSYEPVFAARLRVWIWRITDLFIIPKLYNFLENYSLKSNSYKCLIAGFFSRLLIIPTLIISPMVAFITLPPLYAFHLYCSSKLKNLKKTISQLEIIKFDTKSKQKVVYPHSIEFKYGEFNNYCEKFIYSEDEYCGRLYIDGKFLYLNSIEFTNNDKKELTLRVPNLIPSPYSKYIIKINPKNCAGIAALLQTNTAHILDQLKKQNKLAEFEEEISHPMRRQTMAGGLSRAARNHSPLKILATDEKNIMNLIFFYSGDATSSQTKKALNMLKDESPTSENRKALGLR